MADMQKGRHPMPAMTQCPKREIPMKKSVSDMATLTNLIYYREVAEIKNLGKIMQKTIMEQGKQFYDVWMYHTSDEQQALASAFGERYMLEASLEKMASCTHTGVKDLLKEAIHLHCLSLVKKNLEWYLMNGVISAEAAEDLDATHQLAVKAFVPHMNTAVEGLGVFNISHLHAPIARDYVAFNA